MNMDCTTYNLYTVTKPRRAYFGSLQLQEGNIGTSKSVVNLSIQSAARGEHTAKLLESTNYFQGISCDIGDSFNA